MNTKILVGVGLGVVAGVTTVISIREKNKREVTLYKIDEEKFCDLVDMFYDSLQSLRFSKHHECYKNICERNLKQAEEQLDLMKQKYPKLSFGLEDELMKSMENSLKLFMNK